uniref:endolytic transglycosylase MltG n=1 Tax=Polynucleobacter sp. TaxID=2029855 RepID=UPI0040478E23
MSFYHSLMGEKFHRLFASLGLSQSSGWKRFSLLLIYGLALFYGAIFLVPVVPDSANTSIAEVYKVKILPQSSLSSIAKQLSTQGIQSPPWLINTAGRALFVGVKLKPGTYLLPLHGSLGNILQQIARGDRVRERIAIIPGMSIWQLRQAIDSHPALIHQTKGLNSQELLQLLNLSYPGAEGIFFPDTYTFDPDEPDINIYRRAALAMQKQLNAAWIARDPKSPLKTPYELLTLASIVEKETGRNQERGTVAGVFINRLNLNMPLQTDPTVIYGIGPQFNGNLRKSDLRDNTPYNTYMRRGLTPTPISMPSKESLRASALPAQTDAIYFVAKGDGSSHFSTNLKEHENAVDRYQRKPAAAAKSKAATP